MNKYFFALVLFLGSLAFAQQRALVVIDMQPSFTQRNGDENESVNVDKTRRVIARQIELIQLAKAYHRPIILVEYKGFGPTSSEILEQLAGYTGLKRFEKEDDGMFSSGSGIAEELKNYLCAQHISELVVVGANGAYCVESSIQGALDQHFRVWADNRGIIDFNDEPFEYPFYYDHFSLPTAIVKKYFSQSDQPAVINNLLKSNGANNSAPEVCRAQ